MGSINLVELLATDNFAVYNKKIAKRLGIETSVLLGVLCSLQKSFKDEEFYRSEEELAEDTLLSVYAIRKCKRQLEEVGILQIEKKGLPAKHYFKLNEDKLVSLIASDNENITTSGNELITTGDNENITTIYNKYNNKQNKYSNNNNNACEKETIYDYLQNNGFILSPIHYEEVSTWEDNELTRYAIKQAVLKNIYNIKYISTTLNSYKLKNITTVNQAIEEEENFKNSFKKKEPKKESVDELFERMKREGKI